MVVPGDRTSPGGPAIAPSNAPTEPPPRKRPAPERLNYWMSFYNDRETSAHDLLETIALLKQAGQMQEVEAVLRGYLAQPELPKKPWMYEMLAVALDYNKAGDPAVLQALGYAALQADQPGEKGTPESLLTVADLMAAREVYEMTIPIGQGKTRVIRVADLLDRAAERLPHRPEPLIKSIDLADRRNDPDRMARAVEGLLSLGWPGVDDRWRAEARARALALADRLRQAGREAEAEMLMDRLEAAEPRDVFARLSWDGFGDLDLEVDEPLGATARFDMPRTVLGGALIQNGRGSDTEEIYVCPRGFSGSYTFRVEVIASDPKDPITASTLEVITHEGSDEETVHTFAIDPSDPKPATVTLENGRRTEMLPYIVPKVMVVEEHPPSASATPAETSKAPAPSRR